MQLVQLDAALADSAWGWDTMASSCCSGNRGRFATLRQCPAVPVKVADGSIVSATHIGSVLLRVPLDDGRVERIVLDHVLFHERFSSNLLSGELLTKRLHWQYHSTPRESFVVTPGGGRATLSTRGRVAVLMCAPTGPEPQRLHGALQQTANSATAAAAVERLVRLHERLSHMGWTRMMATLRSGKVDDLGVSLDGLSQDSIRAAEKRVRECAACVQGRSTRTAFGHRGLDRGQQPGECLHMDTYQVKVERDGGRLVTEYGLVVKCLHSGYVWHGQLATKDQVAQAIVDLVQLVQTQFGRVVKRLYTDGGTEFINQTLKAFCVPRGMELHWTPARSQQLNGGAERTVRSFKDHARMMLLHAGAPASLWARAAAHAAFVWNRTHLALDTQMTPYEAMRGKRPSVRHIGGVWGCDAFCHVPRNQRGSLAPKAEPCIYLGHSGRQNAANVLLLASGKVICSRDVTFRDTFTAVRALQRGEDGSRDALPDGRGADGDGADADGAAAHGGSNDASADDDAAVDAHDSDSELEYVVGNRLLSLHRQPLLLQHQAPVRSESRAVLQPAVTSWRPTKRRRSTWP